MPATPRPEPVVLDSRLNPSPWSSFMSAPEPPPAPRRPSATPPSVQRSPDSQPAPPQLTSPEQSAPQQAALQRAVDGAESELPVQEVDLYEALMQGGMAPPNENARVQPPASAARPSASTQASAPPVRTPPPASLQRKAATSDVTSLNDSQLPPPSKVPDPGSVEAAMLDLLNLPPSTSVYGLKVPPPANGQPPSPSARENAVQRTPLDQALAQSERPPAPTEVQRALQIDEMTASVGGEGEGKGQSSEPDVDDLARKVYRILKDRLRIERERSAR